MDLKSLFHEAVAACVKKFPSAPKKPIQLTIEVKATGERDFEKTVLGTLAQGKFVAEYLAWRNCNEVWVKTKQGRFGYAYDPEYREPRFYADQAIAKKVL